MKIQELGICPVCTREQVVKNGKLVAHGYTIGYGFQNGSCFGSGKPHYGMKEAVEVLNQYIENIKVAINDIHERMPAASPHVLATLEQQLRIAPQLIDFVVERIASHEIKPTRTVNVEEQKRIDLAIREAKAQKAKTDKELAIDARAKKTEERKRKHLEKWSKILSENVHQVEVDGEVVVEWVSSYENESAVYFDSANRLREHLKSTGITDSDEISEIMFRRIGRVRENTPKRKQLLKY